MVTEREGAMRLVVIGGGYTGVAFVIHAIRSARLPLTVTIVEPARDLGRGAAYGTTDPDHRINVPSERMSLFGSDRDHATRWFFDHGILPDPEATDRRGHHYVRRRAYGSYVGAVLADTVAAAGAGVAFAHRRIMASAVTRQGDEWVVRLPDGTSLAADVVALCFGHAAPTVPAFVSLEARSSPQFVANPWSPGAFDRIDPASDVLIVGTGLTMADAVASLTRRDHRGRITAVSRRGLLPRTHGQFSDKRDILEGDPAPTTALGLLRLLRRRVVRDEAEMGWHPAVDALRAQLPLLWGMLPRHEKQKVARRLLPFWEVHRFRIAPQIHHAIERSRRRGQLVTERAALVGIEQEGDRIVGVLQPRAGSRERRAFGAVVLCTGPDRHLRDNPLIASLLAAGLVRLDEIGIGLAVDAKSRLIGKSGQGQRGFLALGPLTRGTFGEMTGAPDITRYIESIVPGVMGEAAL